MTTAFSHVEPGAVTAIVHIRNMFTPMMVAKTVLRTVMKKERRR